MLVIRQAQIDAFIKGTDEEFVEFLVEHVTEEFPDEVSKRDDETLRQMIRNGIRRAESHDFTRAEDITAFISVMFEIGPNFDEQKDIRAALDDSRFKPEDRFEQLWSPAITEEHWEEAAANADEKAWFVAV